MKSTKAKSRVQGEGDYASAKKYDQDVRDFVASGRVEQAAKDAAPRDAQEQADMRNAEAKGRVRAKGDDKSKQDGDLPGQTRPEKRAPGKHPLGKPVPEKAPGR